MTYAETYAAFLAECLADGLTEEEAKREWLDNLDDL